MKRKLVIGDIHGGLRALYQVSARAAVTKDDTLIFLGDYVDGWSESAQVVDHLIRLQHEQTCIFIKGNHDEWCEEWLQTGIPDNQWLRHGGEATVQSYTQVTDAGRKQHLEFFERMKYFAVDEVNRLFIHAGFTSMHGPAQEFHSSNFGWDRTLWETARVMDKRITTDSLLYPRRLRLFQEIYIGHTPTIYYNVDEPMQAVNVWNIDTGAGFGAKLTILDIDSKQFWQSDPLSALYPDEKGRHRM